MKKKNFFFRKILENSIQSFPKVVLTEIKIKINVKSQFILLMTDYKLNFSTKNLITSSQTISYVILI